MMAACTKKIATDKPMINIVSNRTRSQEVTESDRLIHVVASDDKTCYMGPFKPGILTV